VIINKFQTERLGTELSDTIVDFLEKLTGPDGQEEENEGSDNESEVSIHSNKSNNSDTTTNATASTTQLTKVLSPTHSILSTDSSKSKDPNRRIRFSDTVIQRVASDDEDY